MAAKLPFKVGDKIELPVHYDMWMRGARYGTVTGYRAGGAGTSAFFYVRMDSPNNAKPLNRRVKLWALDWAYARKRF